MIKIIGKNTWQVSCKTCLSLLQYSYEDILSGMWGDYGGDSGKWQYVICPVCENKVEHK